MSKYVMFLNFGMSKYVLLQNFSDELTRRLANSGLMSSIASVVIAMVILMSSVPTADDNKKLICKLLDSEKSKKTRDIDGQMGNYNQDENLRRLFHLGQPKPGKALRGIIGKPQFFCMHILLLRPSCPALPT